MKRVCWIALCGVALACAPAPAAGASSPALTAFCRRLDAAWAGVRTYQANLKWPNLHSAKLEEQGCGLFLFQRPGRWLMEFHTPNMERYMVRQDTGYVYIDRLKQAIRYHLGPEDRAGVGLLVLGQSTASLGRYYSLSLDPTPEDRSVLKAQGPGLVLVPRTAGAAGFKRAVLFVNPRTSLPEKIRMQLESGEDLRMSLEAARKNAPLHPSVWNFVVPEGTYVLDR